MVSASRNLRRMLVVAAALTACASLRYVVPAETPEPTNIATGVPMLDSDRVPIGNAPTRGPADALVTVVEFGDFECGFCARIQPSLARLRDRYPTQVRWVFKHLPLRRHRFAREAALAAEEIYAQRGATAFWTFHDRIFASADELDRDALIRIARDLQVDEQRFISALDQRSHEQRVREDEQLARSLAIDATPAIVVNGTVLIGARPYPELEALIEAVLTRARTITPRDRVYALMTAQPVPLPERVRPANQRRPRLDPNARYRLPIEDAPARGPATASATIVVFSDFECPYCSRARSILDALQQRYPTEVRLVFRHTPLSQHPHAREAAEASIEVLRQRGPEAFWSFHNELFDHQHEEEGLARPALETYARALRVDRNRFVQALDQHTHAARVEADETLSRAVGVRGTPTCYLNGRRLARLSPEHLSEAVEAAIVEARALRDRGVAPERVYDTLIENGATAPVFLPDEQPHPTGTNEAPGTVSP